MRKNRYEKGGTSVEEVDLEDLVELLKEKKAESSNDSSSTCTISPSLSYIEKGYIEEGLTTNPLNFKEVDSKEKTGRSSSKPNIISRKIDKETRIKDVAVAVIAFAMKHPTLGRSEVVKRLRNQKDPITPPITDPEVQKIFEMCQLRKVKERIEKTNMGYDESIKECVLLFFREFNQKKKIVKIKIKKQRFTAKETVRIKKLMRQNLSHKAIREKLQTGFNRRFSAASIFSKIQQLLKKGTPYMPEKNTLNDPKVTAIIKEMIGQGFYSSTIAKCLQNTYGMNGFSNRTVSLYIQRKSLRNKK